MPCQYKVLLADDEESLRLVLQSALTKAGYSVDTVDNGQDAVEKLRESEYVLAIFDIRMPKKDGLQAFYEVHASQPDLPIILMTAYGSAEIAVEAMKNGAFDYITKPFNIEEVKILVHRAIYMQRLAREVKYLTEEVMTLSKGVSGLNKIIGNSPKIQEVYKSIGRVANSRASVLLTGESGTGKGLVAKSIHYNSDRWQKPFVQVNCGAIPEGLLESELFGHEKGAFTGAVCRRIGKFEQAAGGTLFLDEIGEMGPALQVKLLRILQDRQFERVGGTETIHSDVRVIAATNRNLEQEIAAMRFRQDLFYRLNVVSIHLPPLREREDDIRLLAEYFLRRFAAESNREKIIFSPQAIDIILCYSWPGNVRELENAVEHALIMSQSSVILPEDLPSSILGREQNDHESQDAAVKTVRPLREAISEAEKIAVSNALQHTQGNRLQAANLLQISRRALQYKIQEYGLT